jgi:HK97 family phage portal protein
VRHALVYFERGRERPAGVLSVSPGMSNDALERLREHLRNVGRAHCTMLVNSEATYTPLSGPLDDAQFVEQRRLVAQEVARVFRLPSHMLNAGTGGDSLTYSTAESMAIDFVRFSLTPWLRRIELAVSNDRDLCFERQYVRFEVDGLLRADAKTRSEVYAAALDPITGWMSRDEVRELEDLEPEQTPPAPAASNGAGNAERMIKAVSNGSTTS